jgi:signal transduction histidine kinase
MGSIYILIVISVAGIGLLVTGFILLQVRNQQKLLRQQKELTDAELIHQKKLLEAEITSQETERLRIGKDLHDEVGSTLSSLRLLIEGHTEKKQSAAAVAEFNTGSKKIIDRVINNVRQISHNLSPHINGSFGFYDAVSELCESLNTSGVVSLTLDFKEPGTAPAINNNIAMAIYRVLAELINNTIKHAKATTIYITIVITENNIDIRYADDGIGFLFNSPVSSRGMGLQNIESRLTMVHAKWQFPPGNKKGFTMDISVSLN